MDDSKLGSDLEDPSPKRFKKERENNESEEASDNKETIDRRKWEDLPINCLVDIFERLHLEDLTLGVPFVCKSWNEALQDPFCWKTFDFDEILPYSCAQFSEKFKASYGVETFKFRGFLKVVIRRSHKLTTKLMLPKGHFPLSDLVYLCKECPLLHIFTSEGKETAIRGLILKMHNAILKFHYNS